MGRSKNCKRTPKAPAFELDESKRLRAIDRKVNAGDYASALQQVNTELASESKPLRRGKLLGQAARTLFKRGKFAEASQAFTQAAQLTSSHARDWFPMELARIKALIKDVSLSEAVSAAHACLARAQAKLLAFDQARASAATELQRTGRATVPLKPLRLSVVASELGELFFNEGELDTAKIFFENATSGNPRGGTRARQGLAEIALRVDDAPQAFQLSVEALTLGKFQAKTIASWKPYFAAKRKMGQTSVSAEFLAAIKVCRPSVRARTTLTIVRELRSSNDPQWKTISADWLATESQKFPEVAAELRKLQMSEAKRALSDPAAQVAAASALLATDTLAPHEWIAGAKEFVRASLFANANLKLNQLVADGRKRFGASTVPQIQHSLALSCMMAKRHDLARPVLRDAIRGAVVGSHIWSKATWALGRMEALLKNHAAAADAFRLVARTPVVPQRFQLQAQMLWAENLLASGDPQAIRLCKAEIPGLLQGISDFETLLDFARQLSTSADELRPLAVDIFTQGQTLAQRAFASATHPSVALDILFKLTCRQVYDFGRSPEATAFWESLSEQKKLWLWNNDNRWWGYVAFVLLAYVRTGRFSQATQIAKDTLNDPATPREALPTILIPYYEELILRRSSAESLEAFRWIVTENPTKAGCATAYYWLALDAYRRKETTSTRTFCEALLASNPHTEVTYDQWMLESKARLLLADLNPSAIPAQESRFDPAWMEKAARQLRYHLTLLER